MFYEKDFYVTIPDIGMNEFVKPAGFLKMLQEIGAYHSDSCGFGLKDVGTTGIVWILIGWKLKILDFPIWSSKLHIKTWSRGMFRTLLST